MKIDVEKMFGKEETIEIQTSDARFKYYTWLLHFFGINRYNWVTNKCPMYQFMIWGTFSMLIVFPFYLMGKILLYTVFAPILLYLDSFEELVNDSKNNPALFTLVTTVISLLIVLIALIIMNANWVLVLFVITGITLGAVAIPWAVVYFIYSVIPWDIVFVFSIYIAISIVIVEIVFYLFLKLLKIHIGQEIVKASCKVRDKMDHVTTELSKTQIFDTAEKPKKPKKPKKRRKFNFNININFKFLDTIAEYANMFWEITGTVVSNHCPPVEFIDIKTIKGTIKYDRGNYSLVSDNSEDHVIIFENKKVTEGDELSIKIKYKLSDLVKNAYTSFGYCTLLATYEEIV
jgi:hypothetical protein